MVFFAAVQSNNGPSEDEDDDDQENPDKFDVENYKGLEIRTLNPSIYSFKKPLNLYFMIKKCIKAGIVFNPIQTGGCNVPQRWFFYYNFLSTRDFYPKFYDF